MNKLIVTLIAAVLFTGCATQHESKAHFESIKKVEQGVLSIEALPSRQDVAFYPSSTEHVVGRKIPNGLVTFGHAKPTKSGSVDTASSAFKPAEGKTAEVAGVIKNPSSKVWERYCSGKVLSNSELSFIEEQNIPSKWVGKCRPAK